MSGLGGEEGLTLNGFKEMFLYEFEQNRKQYASHKKATDKMYDWLYNLGFDNQLFPVRSRLFTLTIHSSELLECKVKDAVQTDLDQRASLLVVEKFGQEIKKSEKGYRVLYTVSDKIFGYTYAIQNITNHKTIRVKLDC